jgi:hypothetical protein
MDETRRQFVLQLMQPMLREFNKTLFEMRDRGQTETEIAAMVDKVEMENRGKVEDWILDAIMSELGLAARPEPKCCSTLGIVSRKTAHRPEIGDALFASAA